jgi:PhoH-like ATPase
LKKTFVLDTNVLLHDPQAIFKFKEHDVVIPITVIEEVDRFKKDMSEIGRNARQISRFLDQMRDRGSVSKGVQLENGGGTLRVALVSRKDAQSLPEELEGEKADNRILSIAYSLFQAQKAEGAVIFVTKDTNLRIKADALGIPTEDYEHDKVRIDELYTGVAEIMLPPGAVDEFYEKGQVALPADSKPLYANEYAIMRGAEDATKSALARYDKLKNALVVVPRIKEGIWGIFPKNKEQAFVCDALLNDEIKLVTLVGKAGTGKTLLALAAGLQKVADENVYRKLLVSRPVFPLGKDIGFLPGDIEEKLNPWMKPIFDNIELLLEINPSGKKKVERGYEELMHMNILEIEPLTYIRGRSIPHQFMIIDEAQNLTPHEMKTILTRAGDNTKIILTGDPYQIDNPYVDSSSNGLSYVVEKFKAEPISAHVTLTKGERSALAELAANLL